MKLPNYIIQGMDWHILNGGDSETTTTTTKPKIITKWQTKKIAIQIQKQTAMKVWGIRLTNV